MNSQKENLFLFSQQKSFAGSKPHHYRQQSNTLSKVKVQLLQSQDARGSCHAQTPTSKNSKFLLQNPQKMEEKQRALSINTNFEIESKVKIFDLVHIFMKQSEMSRFIVPNIKNYRKERDLSKLRKLRVQSKFAESKLDSTFNQMTELQQQNKTKEDIIDKQNVPSENHNHMLSGKLLRKLSNNFKNSQKNQYISQNQKEISMTEKKKDDFLSDYEDKIDELFHVKTQQQTVKGNLPAQISNKTSKFINKQLGCSKSKDRPQQNLKVSVKEVYEHNKNGTYNFFSPQAQQYQLTIPKYNQLQRKSFQNHYNSIDTQQGNTDRTNTLQDKKISKILSQQQGKTPHKPYFY